MSVCSERLSTFCFCHAAAASRPSPRLVTEQPAFPSAETDVFMTCRESRIAHSRPQSPAAPRASHVASPPVPPSSLRGRRRPSRPSSGYSRCGTRARLAYRSRRRCFGGALTVLTRRCPPSPVSAEVGGRGAIRRDLPRQFHPGALRARPRAHPSRSRSRRRGRGPSAHESLAGRTCRVVCRFVCTPMARRGAAWRASWRRTPRWCR